MTRHKKIKEYSPLEKKHGPRFSHPLQRGSLREGKCLARWGEKGLHALKHLVVSAAASYQSPRSWVASPPSALPPLPPPSPQPSPLPSFFPCPSPSPSLSLSILLSSLFLPFLLTLPLLLPFFVSVLSLFPPLPSHSLLFIFPSTFPPSSSPSLPFSLFIRKSCNITIYIYQQLSPLVLR